MEQRVLVLADVRVVRRRHESFVIVTAPDWAFRVAAHRRWREPIPEAWAAVKIALDALAVEDHRQQSEEYLARLGRVARGEATEWDKVCHGWNPAPPGKFFAEIPRIWRGRKSRLCRRCRKPFLTMANHRYCTDACAEQTREGSVQRANRKAIAAKAKDRAQARAGRACANCGVRLDAERSTLRYCGGRCRVAAHRKKDAPT